MDEIVVADPDARSVRIRQRRDEAYVETAESALLEVSAAVVTAGIDWP